MCVPSRKIIKSLQRKLGSDSSGYGAGVPLQDLVEAANEAYDIFIENATKREEVDKYYREVLRRYEVKNFKITPTKVEDGVYYFEYPEDLYTRLNQKITASCYDGCGSKRIIPRIVQSDDLHEALQNPYRKPDFRWEQGLADEAKNGLYVYTNNEYCVEGLTIDYRKRHSRIEAPSLLECDPKEYTNDFGEVVIEDTCVELEDRNSLRTVIDIATLIASGDNRDSVKFKEQLEKIFTINKL